MQLVLRAKQLNQPVDMPVAVYKTKKGKVIYLTGNKIAELLRKAVKDVRPNTTPDKLKRYSAHSLSHPEGLGLRIARRGRKVAGLYQEEALLAG